jgi:hypothetical protein
VVSVSLGGGGRLGSGDPDRGPDFCRWLQVADKPTRPHWRRHGEPPITGGARSPGRRSAQPYAVSVRAQSETVLRSFYDFHRDLGTGPILNTFPLDRSRRRRHAHRNPMDPPRHERTGLYRPTVPARVPRSVPDAEFNEIFARLGSHRDRALVAFYVSTGPGPASCCRLPRAGSTRDGS